MENWAVGSRHLCEARAGPAMLRRHGAGLGVRCGFMRVGSARVFDGGAGRARGVSTARGAGPVSYTHLRAHETVLDLVCRLLLEKKKKSTSIMSYCISTTA